MRTKQEISKPKLEQFLKKKPGKTGIDEILCLTKFNLYSICQLTKVSYPSFSSLH